MRPAKRRALQGGEEPTLYDEIAAEEAGDDTPEEANTSGEEGEAPPKDAAEVQYLETEDEEELRAVISNLDDVVEELLPIPEWKTPGKDGTPRVVTILIRSLTSFERTQFLRAMNKGGASTIDFTKMYADLVILSARHPKTKRLLFKNADRGMLNTRHGAATERIAMRASEMSGLSEAFLKSIRKNS